MDRDWEQRRYLATFAFAQKLLWIAPMLMAVLLTGVAEMLGAAPDGPATLTILLLGFVGSLVTLVMSLYRWFIGYGRTDWQKKQASEQRAATRRARRHTKDD